MRNYYLVIRDKYFSHFNLSLFLFCSQYSRIKEREKSRRGPIKARQGEFRVLRAGQNVTTARGHHVAARQSVDHSAHH